MFISNRAVELIVLANCALTGCAIAGPADGADGSRLRVFITAQPYTGDLAAQAGVADGLGAADTICTVRADAAGFGGTWRAWLSSSTVDAIDRIESDGPWYLVDQERVAFSSRAGLQTEPLIPVETDELGNSNLFGRMWTATRHGGRRSSTDRAQTCWDWTMTRLSSGVLVAMTGWVGSTDLDWTESIGADHCENAGYLMCLEQ